MPIDLSFHRVCRVVDIVVRVAAVGLFLTCLVYVVFFRKSGPLVGLPLMQQEFDALSTPEGAVAVGDSQTINRPSQRAVGRTYRVPHQTATGVLGFYRQHFAAQGWRERAKPSVTRWYFTFCKGPLVAHMDLTRADAEYGCTRVIIEAQSGDDGAAECPATASAP